MNSWNLDGSILTGFIFLVLAATVLSIPMVMGIKYLHKNTVKANKTVEALLIVPPLITIMSLISYIFVGLISQGDNLIRHLTFKLVLISWVASAIISLVVILVTKKSK